MNVLSLFDGMSCGQLALQRAGLKYDNYFAAEIDKHAIKVTTANFPDTIQIGDVTKVRGEDLPKIDLLIGGSPCQGFSFAGKMLNFEDPRSKLFFEFVRLLHELQPKYFLLENVKMKKESELVITQALNCYPIEINSALVSAQNRRRLYWTNINSTHTDLFGCMIPGIEQPEDRHLFLKDIIEPEVDAKYYLTEKQIEMLLQHKQRHEEAGNGFGFQLKTINDKAITLVKSGNGVSTGSNYLYCDYRTDEGLRIRENGKAGTIQARAREDKYGAGMVIQTNQSTESNGQQPYQQNRVYSIKGKSPALTAQLSTGSYIINCPIRRLTPIECERLQTVPDNYTNHVSETQRYKMLGNGWTIDVIAHILSYI